MGKNKTMQKDEINNPPSKELAKKSAKISAQKPSKKSVTASAPGKLMLSIGFAVVHGYPTIVTAVDQRLSVTVRKNGVDVFELDAPDLGLHSYAKTISDLGKKSLPKSVRFIEMLYKRFLDQYPQKEGIVVTTSSDFSALYGFGSSSAATVAFAKALTTLYDINLSKQKLFDLCYQAVLDVQGVGSGYDLAAAIWGGTIYYEKPAKIVKNIKVNNLPITVAYSGEKADTPTLIRMVDRLLEYQPETTQDVFKEISAIAHELVVAIESENWKEMGALFDRSQICAKKLGVSSVMLDDITSAVNNTGALGSTSSGAGGGDCVLAVVLDDKKIMVNQAINSTGAKVVKVGLNAQGVRIESSV